MTTQTVDPRLRMAPPYIGWVPGEVNLLRSAPKVPAGSGTAGSAGASGVGSAAGSRVSASNGSDWAAISGQG